MTVHNNSGVDCMDFNLTAVNGDKQITCSEGSNVEIENNKEHFNTNFKIWKKALLNNRDSESNPNIKLRNKEDYLNYKVVPKNTLGIQDPGKTFNTRGKWLPVDNNITMLRRHSISETQNNYAILRHRTISSNPVTPRKTKTTENCTTKNYITSFHRSLKLLGLQPEDLGIKSEIIKTSNTAHIQRKGPTFQTRLTKRSFSVENLRTAIQEQIGDSNNSSRDHLDRKTLANAVYEEWYFQKLEEAKKKKEEEMIKEQRKQEYMEKLKEEQKQKSEENFMKWRELKKKQKELKEEKQEQQNKKMKNEYAGSSSLMNGGTLRMKQSQEEAFLLWKREKDKLVKLKKVEKMKKEAEKTEDDKTASAQSAFLAWKKQADEVLKEKLEKEKKHKEQEEKDKKLKEEEKRESAKSSFQAWKRSKDEELRRKRQEKMLLEEEKRSEKLMRDSERGYEAEQAFEEWLDQIEERRARQIKAMLHYKKRKQQQMPWSPGGSSNW